MNQPATQALPTPYYLIDKTKLIANMQKIAYLREQSGAKALLALKCFATWSVFDVMSQYMDGTTSSSLFEVRLGQEKFGGETHAYSVAYAEHEIDAVISHCDKIIFNSINQLNRFAAKTKGKPIGLRLNPNVSSSDFIIADPARPHSRLGESDINKIRQALPQINGVMIHNNCENADFDRFDAILSDVEHKFADIFYQLDWVSLGGGIHFTGEGYPIDKLAQRLKSFSKTYGVQVYLEPGEAAITGAATLEVTVLDTLENNKHIAVVDASIEAHMLDLLIYRESAAISHINNQMVAAQPLTQATPPQTTNQTAENTLVCGKSCLAGDIFGEYTLTTPLQVGDRLSFANAAGYTMVKKNWFNGVAMPAIVLKEPDGTLHIVRNFGYADYKASLS